MAVVRGVMQRCPHSLVLSIDVAFIIEKALDGFIAALFAGEMERGAFLLVHPLFLCFRHQEYFD